LTTAGFAVLVVAVSSAQPNNPGIWAAAGQQFNRSAQFTESGAIYSPHRKLSISRRDGVLSLIGTNQTTRLDDVPATPSLTEVLWAPDSSAFVVNASDGGLIGSWNAYVYSVASDDRPTARNLRGLIEPHAKGVARCATDEVVNLGVAAWLQGGEELLAVIEVPPHSSCQNMAAIVGYRVSLSKWTVVGRVSSEELQTTWSRFLGRRFTKQWPGRRLVTALRL
jgi:hypothetical protein